MWGVLAPRGGRRELSRRGGVNEVWTDGVHVFKVLIRDNDGERRRGALYRNSAVNADVDSEGDESAWLREAAAHQRAQAVARDAVVPLLAVLEALPTGSIVLVTPLGAPFKSLYARSIDTRLAAAATLMRGLAQLHAGGVLHADVKPENIVLLDGQPRLTDFGLSRTLLPTQPDAPPADGAGAFRLGHGGLRRARV